MDKVLKILFSPFGIVIAMAHGAAWFATTMQTYADDPVRLGFALFTGAFVILVTIIACAMPPLFLISARRDERIRELLTANNRLLERARKAEEIEGYAVRNENIWRERSAESARLVSKFTEENALLRATLTEAGEKFKGYAALHVAKGTPEGRVKAADNLVMAERCFDAVEKGKR